MRVFAILYVIRTLFGTEINTKTPFFKGTLIWYGNGIYLKKKTHLTAVILAISLYVHFREEFRECDDKAEVSGWHDLDKR